MLSLTAPCKLHEASVGLSASSASLAFTPPGDKRKEGRMEGILLLLSLLFSPFLLFQDPCQEKHETAATRTTRNPTPLQQMLLLYIIRRQ